MDVLIIEKNHVPRVFVDSIEKPRNKVNFKTGLGKIIMVLWYVPSNTSRSSANFSDNFFHVEPTFLPTFSTTFNLKGPPTLSIVSYVFPYHFEKEAFDLFVFLLSKRLFSRNQIRHNIRAKK